MYLEIEVKIVEVIYHNDKNGYTVAIGENDELQCSVVGNLPLKIKGRRFRLRGNWKTHPRYGEQFFFSEYEEKTPEGENEIIDFLSSRILKGIGARMARHIVEHFKDKTLEIIEKSPERLTEVSGIGEAKAQIIYESYCAHKDFATVSFFFQQFDIGSNYALKFYKQYGKDAIELIKANPYRMIADLRGVGFKKADIIAKKMGLPNDDPYRIESGIKFELSQAATKGNTFMFKRELCERAAVLLEVNSEQIEETITAMAFDGRIQVDRLYGSECVFLHYYYNAERNVCKRLVDLVEATPKAVTADIGKMLDAIEDEKGLSLSQNQRYAVTAAVANSVCVITGGPGTGKTTIINAMIRAFTNSGLEVAIAAPTGRAAKRITETSGANASTIHRLLEYSFSEDEDILRFGKNAENPLDYDAIIIDEASMIDLLLMNGLLTAIKPGTRLILVGDADQLPSVGAGNVLRDIIDSECIYCVSLTEIFRQAKESLIVVNAHRINKGEYPDYTQKEKDFFLIRQEKEQDMLETIKDLCVRRLPNAYPEIEPMRDIQVLTPVRNRKYLGSFDLNKELQETLNPPKPFLAEKRIGERVFRQKDKVMQTKNNYGLKWKRLSDSSDGEGIFNGDMGIVHSIDKEENKINVVFDEDKFVTYDHDCFDELELAYAVTVHKSQGSEFPIMIMPISWFPPILTTRNLLYTAVTRGKKLVILVGSESKLHAMVDNNEIEKRNSGLGERIVQMRDLGLLSI